MLWSSFEPLGHWSLLSKRFGAGRGRRKRDFPRYTYPSYDAIFEATDAISTYTALKVYFEGEDALTSLQRIEFAMSQYATFAEHIASAIVQAQGGSGIKPMPDGRRKGRPSDVVGNGGKRRREARDSPDGVRCRTNGDRAGRGKF